MRKKYQVFVSSTYLDLKHERQAAVEAILLAEHIPAGMELFSAGDESQLEVIKKWIEASDIYMLILGGRYGSIEPKSGRSYIEMEYDHAVSLKKPLFALVLNDKAIETKGKTDTSFVETAEKAKLKEFRDKVLSKVSREVEDHKDVKLYTLEALGKMEGRDGLIGWIRANESVDIGPVLEQLTGLNKENSALREQVEELRSRIRPTPAIADLAGLDEKMAIRATYTTESRGMKHNKEFKMPIGEVFALIAPKLLEHPADAAVQLYLKQQLFAFAGTYTWESHLNEQDFQTLKVQLTALDLIDTRYIKTTAGGMALFWSLTENGEQELLQRRALRKAE